MEHSDKTARQLYEELKSRASNRSFGFGSRPALVNVDLQNAYTRTGEFGSAYDGHPRQIEYINELSSLIRSIGLPVVWTYIAYAESGQDCGVWRVRANTPDAIQNMKIGSRRSELDTRLLIDHERDVLLNKRMASAFFETHLGSLLTFHQIDTVIVTGGSTSGCVRATVVDSLSRGYRTVVPEECVAHRHESPHFASLFDMAAKYADVLATDEVVALVRRAAASQEKTLET